MDGLHMLVVLFGVVSYSHGWISGPVLKVAVRPGDNITVYCDCKISTGVYIVWYRNCTHENQPTLVLKQNIGLLRDPASTTMPGLSLFPRYQFVRNSSSESYDLLIKNITDSDEGLYYCGTVKQTVEDKLCIIQRLNYSYGNVTTRIILDSDSGDPRENPDCAVYRVLLFSLCPASAVLSSLLSSLVVYHICHKTAKEPQVDQQKPETRGRTRLSQDEDVCYAALEIRQPSQRPKKKKTQSSDFSTYSAINTSRV
ncbi:uncharacterized protein LOC127367473 isoform X1 [Dicentrarchus labrax]|uniref:uncharacterized protein LOC127367473 isoform X1 n=1 Tax=Dicentrarchus labrax TaxID=13489 RepID=UPI0021F58447|nr:uncharacterized protein LOC127367473 isoform X1 [Dicentrarchus labrax]